MINSETQIVTKKEEREDKKPKGPAIKKFMPLVVIIEAHDALRNFWIW